ncbi:MAG: ABC transporter ATP-binding protein [Sphingosinicella sp.]
MMVGGLAEIISIGAVLPFLALLTDPSLGEQVPAVRFLLQLLGGNSAQGMMVSAVILLIGAAIFAAVVRLLLTWVSQNFVLQLGHEIGVEIYRRLLRQPYSFHVQRNTSQSVSGVEKVQIAVFAVLLPIMQGFVAAVIALFIVVALVLIDPVSAMIAGAAMAALYLGVSLSTRTLLARNSRVLAQNQTARVQLVQEGLGGIRDILIDQSQPVFEEAFRKIDYAFRRAQSINAFVAAAPRFVVEGVGIVLIALLALAIGGQPGELTAAIPVIGALALGAQRILPLLQQMFLGWSQFVGSGQIVLDVVALMRTPIVHTVPRSQARSVKKFRREIELIDLSYRYPGSSEPAVCDLNFTIKRGERIGFLGQTGSGKSTLLDLIMGLLEPTSGRILTDGSPLEERSRVHWQAQIAHVPQHVYLSDSSMAANIAFGEPADAIDIDLVRTAAEQAQIHAFIRKLPEGYESRVGERGVRLSGGQRQRIGIARALYRRADVLILDEATSALDDQTEAAVMAALSGLGREVTILMIAHRLSTLSGCDRLIRLESGRIIEEGSFAQLVGSDVRRTAIP